MIKRSGAKGSALSANSSGGLAGIIRLPAETFFAGERKVVVADISNLSQVKDTVSTATARFNCYNFSIETNDVIQSTRTPEISSSDNSESFGVSTSESTNSERPVSNSPPIQKSISLLMYSSCASYDAYKPNPTTRISGLSSLAPLANSKPNLDAVCIEHEITRTSTLRRSKSLGDVARSRTLTSQFARRKIEADVGTCIGWRPNSYAETFNTLNFCEDLFVISGSKGTPSVY